MTCTASIPGGEAAEIVEMLHRYHPDLAAFKIILHGHTHQRMVRNLGDWVFINAGTLLYGDSPCFSVVDLSEKWVQFYDRHPFMVTITESERHTLP